MNMEALLDGVPVPLFPWNISAFSIVPQNKNLNFLGSLFPQNYICSPVPFIFRLVFPCSPEINIIILLVPITTGRASIRCNHMVWAKTTVFLTKQKKKITYTKWNSVTRISGIEDDPIYKP